MEKIKFLTAALVALTMFSCTQEDVNPDRPGEKAKLIINVVAQDQGTKATGGVDDEAKESEIHNYIVFVFDARGGKDAIVESTDGGSVDITGTTNAKKAYVVANTGDLATGMFKDVTTEDELKAVTGDLLITVDAFTQTKDKLWMHGSKEITFTDGVGSAEVQMGFSSARIDLIVIDKRDLTGTNTITDQKVALLFAAPKCNLFGAVVEQTPLYSGLQNYANYEASTLKSVLSETVNFSQGNTATTVAHHFYVFPNHKNNALPTILTIQSELNKDGATSNIFYPYHFSLIEKDTQGEYLQAGKKYTVTMTLNGKLADGGGTGTTDPEVPFGVSADITVTVKAAKWETKTIAKEFT